MLTIPVLAGHIRNFLINEGHNMPDNPALAPPDTTVPTPDTPLAPKAPANMADIVAQLPPSVADFMERAIADKQNAQAALKAAQAATAKAEALAQQLTDEKATAQRKTLEEQGEYKALYEKSELEKQQLFSAFQDRTMKEVVKTELVKHGVIDEDVTDLVLKAHKELIRYADGQVVGVADAVGLFKANKPAFFTQQQPAPAAAQPVSSYTGIPVVSPTPGTPGAFNARTASKEDADAHWATEIAKLRGK